MGFESYEVSDKKEKLWSVKKSKIVTATGKCDSILSRKIKNFSGVSRLPSLHFGYTSFLYELCGLICRA